MATVNKTKTTARTAKLKSAQTVNEAGGIAYKLSPHQKLIEQVLGAFWSEDSYYRKGSATASDIVKGVHQVAAIEPKFVLQLAAFARNELHMRTTPQVLLVEAATIGECKPYIREYAPKIVRRADELADAIAYYIGSRGSKKNFPNALKDGLAKAFSNFDEYQLNKYDSDKAEVALGDVVKLVHPNFGEEKYSKAMYAYLTRGEVDAEALPKIGALKALLAKDSIDEEALDLIRKSNVTWETLISKFGSTKENWELVAPNMGYMALLRNLRNFQEKGVDLTPILARISNAEEVKRSKQLPFRFFSAYKQVTDQKIQRAIAKAFDLSISNVQLDGSTAVMIDLSGSMGSRLSDKSSVELAEVASVLGAIVARKAAESVVIGFSDYAKEASINPDDTMITNVQKIRTLTYGGGTNAGSAFQLLGTRKVDRIVLISDMQCYGKSYGYAVGDVYGAWKKYKEVGNPNAHLFSMNIAAYGTSQTPEFDKSVTLLSGWSDKIVDMITLTENREAMINKVRNY